MPKQVLYPHVVKSSMAPRIQRELEPAIEKYIHDVYPYTKGPHPKLVVLTETEWARLPDNRWLLEGEYNPDTNEIWVRETVGAMTICHELEHWNQRMTWGRETFIREKKRDYPGLDKRTDEVALANCLKLNWRWRR